MWLAILARVLLVFGYEERLAAYGLYLAKLNQMNLILPNQSECVSIWWFSA